MFSIFSGSLRCLLAVAVLASCSWVAPLAVGVADVAYSVVALPTPSAVNTTSALPASTTNFDVGTTCYLEVWTTDSGVLNTGVTSAYVDLSWPVPLGVAGAIDHSVPFSLFASGNVTPGFIDELGGSDATLSGQGLAPDWARVAIVPLQIAAPGDLPVLVVPASTPTACFGRGTIAPADIDLLGVTLNAGDDVAVALVVTDAVSGPDQVTTLPTPTTCVQAGGTLYVEVWVSDIGSLNTGITSAYTDIAWDDTFAVGISIAHRPPFTLFSSGTLSAGWADELGGSDSTLAGQGVQPTWARVAAVAMTAAAPGTAVFTSGPASTGIAAFGRGLIPSSNVLFGTASVDIAPMCAITTVAATCAETAGLTAGVPDGGAGVTYAWSVTNGTLVSGQGTSSITYDAAGAGTLTLDVTVTGITGCTCTDSVNVTVHALPSGTAHNGGPYCAGETIELSADGGTSYAWNGPGGFTSSEQNPTIPDATPAHAGTYTVVITDGNNCSASADTFVAVHGLPVATASNGGPYCEGDTIALFATAGASYAWSGPAGFTSNAQNPTIPAAGTANAGDYTVTVTDANGCSATSSTAVIVHIAPVASAGNDGPYCEGETITLFAGGGATYQWTGPGGFASDDQSPTIPAATAGNAGDYMVTVTDSHGCSATAITTVVVSAAPAASASNGGPYCEGDTIALSAMGGTAYAWSGPGSFASSEQHPTIPAATTANAGDYTVTVTDANGCTAFATTTVMVTPLPAASAGNGGPYCEGETIVLFAGGGTAYQWSGPNGFTSSAQNPTLPGATTAQAGSYSVLVTDGNGCSASAATTVVVNAAPTATAGDGGPYCEGDTITLLATGGVAYQWSGPSGFTSSAQNPTIAGATPAHAGTYTVIVTDANGCSASATTTVVVYAAPTASASNGGPYCEGATIELFAAGGATYAWSGPGGFTSSAQNPTVPGAIPTAAGLYSVTVTDANGCSASAATTVVVHTLPVASVHNGGPYCEGDTIELFADGGTMYQWSGPGGFSSSVQNPTIPGAALSQAGDYTVIVTDASGCSASAVTTVVVTLAPLATANNGGPYCVGETIALFASGGTTYAWTGPDGFTSNDQNPTIPGATAADAGDYTVLVSLASGCSAAATTTVVVNPLPVATVSNSGPYCAGETIELFASGGTTYTWSGPASFTSNDQNPTITGATVANAGDYTVIVADANGCTVHGTTSVVIYAAPIATANNTGPYCEGATIELTASGGTAYAWTGPSGFASMVQNPTLPDATMAKAGVYTVTVTDAQGCSATASTTVVVNTAPVAAASNGGPYCVGETVLLLAAPSGMNYQWSGPNGFASALPNPTIPAVTPASAGLYTVVVTDPNTGCAAVATTTVVVDPLPAAAASNNGPVCEGESVVLHADPGGMLYAWTGPNGFSASDQDPVIVAVTAADAGPYIVVVTDPNTGCGATASTTLGVNLLPTPTITAQPGDYLCHDLVVTLDAGAGYTGYLWSTGETTQTISVMTTGVYTVTVTSAAGCAGDATFEVVPGIGARGDCNCDGQVDFKDIDPFVAALGGEAQWLTFLGGNPPCNYLCAADTNKDGVVNFRDIDPFVACLSGHCP